MNNETRYYLCEKDEVLTALNSRESGLNESELKSSLDRFGKNRLKEGKKTPLIVRILKQLSDPMILVLVAAAVISAITAIISGESISDVIIILFVVALNTFLGVFQESKAEKAIEALKVMSKSMVRVEREGRVSHIQSDDIVPGDIVLFEAGDAVPADCRIIEAAALKIEESALTGESLPVNKTTAALSLDGGKDVPLGDRRNMAYMGSSVVYGRGKAVVVATGMNTEIGKIADAISAVVDEKTPLQKKLSYLSKVLTWLVLAICVFVFVFSIVKSPDRGFDTILSTFMLAVSLAVAAIPEGLAAVVTIVLSIGVTNMSKRNAIIRKLTAVETLGCTEIICSDKTGTLTLNKMTVVNTFSFLGTDETLLFKGMAQCSDAVPGENGEAVGEPTECALVNAATQHDVDKLDLAESEPRIGEAPFDSLRKMMSTLHSVDGKVIQFTKGAPDAIISRCDRYIDEKGIVCELSDEKRAEILSANQKMASNALRVLACSFKEYNSLPVFSEPSDIEDSLVFIGLCGMMDPVRDEVKAAIKECRSAGIRPIMITGDHIDTAVAIAKQLGIIESRSEAMTGSELNEVDDATFEKLIEKVSVYARVQPEHKTRIVNMWRRKNKVTAMTGDGVNDAPSIKSADIGVGMGITGTDVTKSVSDMILTDDNFATIVTAVEEGRRIYDNIRKSIQFLLSSNLAEVVAIFTATMFGFHLLEPVHILWVNLVTDTLPAVALGMEKCDPDIMKASPRSSKEGLFSNGLGFDIILQGICIALLVLFSFAVGFRFEYGYFGIGKSVLGETMAFITLSMTEMFHSFNLRSRSKSLFAVKSTNIVLLLTFIASVVLTTAIVFVPALRSVFGLVSVNVLQFSCAVLISIVIIPLVELKKLISRAIHKK